MNWETHVEDFYLTVLEEGREEQDPDHFHRGMRVLLFIRAVLVHVADTRRPELPFRSAHERILGQILDMFPGFLYKVVYFCIDFKGVRDFIERRISCSDIDAFYRHPQQG
ncbi:hypothetical protein LINGRAHAP2_LOCUS26872 [Linum grandiflorum]